MGQELSLYWQKLIYCFYKAVAGIKTIVLDGTQDADGELYLLCGILLALAAILLITAARLLFAPWKKKPGVLLRFGILTLVLAVGAFFALRGYALPGDGIETQKRLASRQMTLGDLVSPFSRTSTTQRRELRDGSGKVIGHCKAEYSLENKLIREEDFDLDERLLGYRLYQRPNEELTRIEEYDADGTLIGVREEELDPERIENPNIPAEIRCYDGEGLLRSEEWFGTRDLGSETFVLLERGEYYDGNGQLERVEEQVFNGSGIDIRYSAQYYNGELIEESVVGESAWAGRGAEDGE